MALRRYVLIASNAARQVFSTEPKGPCSGSVIAPQHLNLLDDVVGDQHADRVNRIDPLQIFGAMDSRLLEQLRASGSSMEATAAWTALSARSNSAAAAALSCLIVSIED